MVLCVCATGCEREGWKPKEADRRQIVVDGTNMTLQTGSVGTGKHEKEATYVLVDAKNPSDMDLSVTLGGQFLDKDDKVVGLMIRQSLRIPSKGVRTFALVNEERVANARATGATIEVTSAVQLDYEEQITITDLHEYKDGDRIVVKGYVRNTVGRIGRAVVFATFYDAKGRPMKRPSTVFRLERKAKRGVQFVGPPGSVRATLSVGDIVY
jgi:hypothetical protein